MNDSTKNYRFGIVGVFLNEAGKILLCERSNLPGSWQFPQGGIDDGEDPVTALKREIREELGTSSFRIVKSSEDITSYDFPPEASFRVAKDFSGQKHYWFLLSFTDGAQPSLKDSDGEFQAFRWADLDGCLKDVIYWKKDAYAQGLKNLGLMKE